MSGLIIDRTKDALEERNTSKTGYIDSDIPVLESFGLLKDGEPQEDFNPDDFRSFINWLVGPVYPIPQIARKTLCKYRTNLLNTIESITVTSGQRQYAQRTLNTLNEILKHDNENFDVDSFCEGRIQQSESCCDKVKEELLAEIDSTKDKLEKLQTTSNPENNEIQKALNIAKIAIDNLTIVINTSGASNEIIQRSIDEAIIAKLNLRQLLSTSASETSPIAFSSENASDPLGTNVSENASDPIAVNLSEPELTPTAPLAVTAPVSESSSNNLPSPIEHQPNLDEEPKVEEPKVEEPKVEESKLEEPKVEESKVEEPKVEESKLEESKLEEPKLEESKLEEPKLEEPKVEESKLEEPKVEEPNENLVKKLYDESDEEAKKATEDKKPNKQKGGNNIELGKKYLTDLDKLIDEAKSRITTVVTNSHVTEPVTKGIFYKDSSDEEVGAKQEATEAKQKLNNLTDDIETALPTLKSYLEKSQAKIADLQSTLTEILPKIADVHVDYETALDLYKQAQDLVEQISNETNGAEVKELIKQIAEKTAHIQTIIEKNTLLTDQLERLEMERAEMEKEDATLKEQLQEALEALEKSQQEIETLNKKRLEMKKAHTEATKQIYNLIDELHTQSNNMEKAKSRKNTMQKSMEAKIKEVENSYDLAMETLNEKITDYEAVVRDKEALAQELSHKDAEITTITEQLSNKNTKISQNTDTITNYKERLAKLNSELSATKDAAKVASNAHIAGLESAKENAEKRTRALEGEYNAINTLLDNLNAKSTSLKSIVEKRATTGGAIKTRLEKKAEEIETYKSYTNQLATHLKNASKTRSKETTNKTRKLHKKYTKTSKTNKSNKSNKSNMSNKILYQEIPPVK